ncbi:DUF4932 domain-containing protein [Ancylomarina sp. YFZ004]
MKKIVLVIVSIILFNCSFGQKNEKQIEISIPEVYELSNVILAITPYGLKDEWEVQKETKYYKEVMAYFMPFAKHPLIEKVNYSREKWDYYLSFRTDAYSFIIDTNGNLFKNNEFRAQDDRMEFEANLDLANDFMKVSKFREFYKNHKEYYNTLMYEYSKSQMIPEMISFLKKEFPLKTNSLKHSFNIVASPLICRMNCHADVSNIPTDFITIPDHILKGKPEDRPMIQYIAQGIHMLFTESDHGFVNPTTEIFGEEVKEKFDAIQWDKESGYSESEFGVFNEYMTWAVYDIFTHKYFPEVADQVCLKWAKQNESRGFIHSTAFNAKLVELYNSKQENETIKDLYPKILRWCLKKGNKIAKSK